MTRIYVNRVYYSNRVDVVKSRIAASGFVENVFEQSEGDYDQRLTYTRNANITNSANGRTGARTLLSR